MFSHNRKISGHQMKAMMILDSLAKLCLLLPVYLSGRSMGTMAVCLMAGLVIWWLFAGLVAGISGEDSDFFTLLSERLGSLAAWIVYVTGCFYFLSHIAVCLNLCASLASENLLPEVPLPVLILLPLAAGIYLAASQVEARGRLGELLTPILLVLILVMTAAAAAGMKADTAIDIQTEESAQADAKSGIWTEESREADMGVAAQAEESRESDVGVTVQTEKSKEVDTEGGARTEKSREADAGAAAQKEEFQTMDTETVTQEKNSLVAGSYEVFACIGGMFLPILLSSVKKSKKEEKKGISRLLCQAVCWSLIPAGILLFVTTGSFGVQGMLAFDFPVVRVMSNVTVPGGFLQRWDVLFLMLLIFSLAFSIGSGFWYLRAIAGRLRRADAWNVSRTGWEVYLFWGVAAVLAFGAAAGFRDPLVAICYYRAFNIYLLTPLLIFTYLALFLRRKKRIVCGAACMLLMGLLLTGCTARELEERSFPMALELRIEDGSVVMTYAWNEGGAPGGQDVSEAEADDELGAEQEKGLTKSDESRNNEADVTRRDKMEADDSDAAQESKLAETEENQVSGIDISEITGNQETSIVRPEKSGNLLVFRADTLAEARAQAENWSERYIDYSHVKALILDEQISEYPDLEQELYTWLAKEPAFAANLLIYPYGENGLTLSQAEERSDGKIGVYLENLYQNNQKMRRAATTLGEKIAEYYAKSSP